MPSENRSRIHLFMLRYSVPFLVFMLIIASRFLNLDADPPVHLSSSGGLFGDEAALAHNARNKVLFGHWRTDEFNPIVYNPILTALEYISFSAFGVGLIQLRLVNVICVVFSFFLLWKILVKSHNAQIATLSIFILGYNYIFTMYNRLGLNDTFIFLPMAATLYFWLNGLKRKPVLFFAGIASFATYITKASSLYFVLATFFSLLFALYQQYLNNKKGRDIYEAAGYYLGGLILCYVCWHLFFLTPLQVEFQRVRESWMQLAWPGTLGRLWYNLTAMTFTKYMNNAPVELFIVWIYLPIFTFLGVRYRKTIHPVEVFIFLWLVGGYMALNGLNYKPLRYFVPLIPAMSLAALFALYRLWNGFDSKGTDFQRSLIPWIILILTVEGLWIHFFFQRCISLQRILQVGYPILGLAVVFSGILFVIEKIQKTSGEMPWKKLIRIGVRSIAAASVAFSFYINGTLYLRWFNHPRYTVIETSKELGQTLQDAVIAGLWSPLATIENRHRSLYVGNNWFNYIDTFNRYRVTHLFLWDGNNQIELRYFMSAYPHIMKGAELIKTYSIKSLPVRLIQIQKKDLTNSHAASEKREHLSH